MHVALHHHRKCTLAVVAVLLAVALVVLLPAAVANTTTSASPTEAVRGAVPGDAQGEGPTAASPWAPFRYVTNETPYWKVVGAEPILANATCELMILGHPKCDAYLTGDAVATHPDGAMMECVARYGIELWHTVLQPQCTSSAFWIDLVRRERERVGGGLNNHRSVGGDPRAIAELMDPIMRQHFGPMQFPFVPPHARSYAPFAPPLVCRPPPLDAEERSLLTARIGDVAEARRVEAMLTRSFVLPTVSDDGSSFELPPLPISLPPTIRNRSANSSRHPLPPQQQQQQVQDGTPMVVYPIGFGYPSELLVRKPFRVKLFDWNPVTPGYYPFYKPKLFKRLKKRRHYVGDARDEYVLGVLQRLTYFAWTHARGGPDCLRHYEILVSGAVPYFVDIGLLPPWAVSHLPKELLTRALHLGGVDHMGPVDVLLRTAEERALYDQSIMPSWAAMEWKRQRVLLLNRYRARIEARSLRNAEANRSRNGDDDGTNSSSGADGDDGREIPRVLLRLWETVCSVDRSATDDVMMVTAMEPAARVRQYVGDDPAVDVAAGDLIVFGAFAATRTEWTVWLVSQQHEEYFDEGSPYLHQIRVPEKTFSAPIQNEYYFRSTGAPTFNFLGRGNIRHANFSQSAYFALADALHAYTKQYLSNAAVAAYFLNATGNETPRHVLFFGTYHCNYMAATLWRGLLELGTSLTSVSLAGTTTQEVRQGPTLVPERSAPHSKLMRSFDASGAKVKGWNGAVYESWRNAVELDQIYGKNFMVGKRIPRHPVISEALACRRMLEGAYDLIVLQSVNRISPFGAHPCAREIRTIIQRDQQWRAAAGEGEGVDGGGSGSSSSSTHGGGGVRVAYVDGNDVMLQQVVESFHREGIQIFAREASCW